MNMRLQMVLAAGLVLVVSSAGYAGAIAHWSFDETSGASVTDDVGGFNGTQPSGTIDLTAAGQFNTGAHFTGDAWYNTPNVTGWRNDDFTVATWVKLDNTAAPQTVFAKWWNPWEFRFAFAGGMNLRNSSNVDIVAGSTLLGDTAWHHAAWVWTKSTGKLAFYKDGSPVTTLTAGTPNQNIRNTGSGVNIGRKGDGGATANLEGTLDELWVFNEALTVGQITSLKNSNVIPEPSTLALAAVGLLGLRRRRR